MVNNGTTQSGIFKWSDAPLRAFISHTSANKTLAAAIRDELNCLGIAAFVAHEDIRPTLDWRTEVIHALSTMNLFIAMLTEDFRQSEWTDQEVGAAVVRGVTIYSADFGLKPYGFLAPYQAARYRNPDATTIAQDVFGASASNPELAKSAKASFVSALESSVSYHDSDQILSLMPKFESFTSSEEVAFLRAFNLNKQVHGSIEWSGFPVLEEILRLTGKEYALESDGEIDVSGDQLDDQQTLDYVFGFARPST